MILNTTAPLPPAATTPQPIRSHGFNTGAVLKEQFWRRILLLSIPRAQDNQPFIESGLKPERYRELPRWNSLALSGLNNELIGPKRFACPSCDLENGSVDLVEPFKLSEGQLLGHIIDDLVL